MTKNFIQLQNNHIFLDCQHKAMQESATEAPKITTPPIKELISSELIASTKK